MFLCWLYFVLSSPTEASSVRVADLILQCRMGKFFYRILTSPFNRGEKNTYKFINLVPSRNVESPNGRFFSFSLEGTGNIFYLLNFDFCSYGLWICLVLCFKIAFNSGIYLGWGGLLQGGAPAGPQVPGQVWRDQQQAVHRHFRPAWTLRSRGEQLSSPVLWSRPPFEGSGCRSPHFGSSLTYTNLIGKFNNNKFRPLKHVQ